MKRMILPLLAAGTVMMVIGSAAAQDLVEEGRAFAEKNCANCHAVGKEGDSRLPVAPPFRTLHEKYPVENLEEALAEGIITSHPAMPVFQLEPPQIAALIEYLNSLKQ